METIESFKLIEVCQCIAYRESEYVAWRLEHEHGHRPWFNDAAEEFCDGIDAFSRDWDRLALPFISEMTWAEIFAVSRGDTGAAMKRLAEKNLFIEGVPHA